MKCTKDVETGISTIKKFEKTSVQPAAMEIRLFDQRLGVGHFEQDPTLVSGLQKSRRITTSNVEIEECEGVDMC